LNRFPEQYLLKSSTKEEEYMTLTPLQKAYDERLLSAEQAAGLIASGAKVALALGAGQPPALLAALAERARRGEVENVRLHYLLCTGVAGSTVLDYDLTDRLIPFSYFHGGVERALDKRRRTEGLPALEIIPCHFSQVPRSLVEHVGVDHGFADGCGRQFQLGRQRGLFRCRGP
jgi:itaconate CoA-transferase